MLIAGNSLLMSMEHNVLTHRASKPTIDQQTNSDQRRLPKEGSKPGSVPGIPGTMAFNEMTIWSIIRSQDDFPMSRLIKHHPLHSVIDHIRLSISSRFFLCCNYGLTTSMVHGEPHRRGKPFRENINNIFPARNAVGSRG